MRRLTAALACLALSAPLARAATAPWGVDVSDAPAAEAGGFVFRDVDGVAADPLVIATRHGAGVARIRVWHTPADGACGLAPACSLAARAHRAGLRVWLDLHYSDTWADPGHQAMPAAWVGLDATALADSVRRYARACIVAAQRAGGAPGFVQLGNEITAGMLWPAGRLDGARGWDALAPLLRAAIAGVRDAPGGDTLLTVLHLDAGGDSARCAAFARAALAHGVAPDAWAVSYYPWWHGSLDGVRGTIASLAALSDRPIWIAETGAPWTLTWFDTTHNVVGEPAQCLPGYAASRAGQCAFFGAVRSIVAAQPHAAQAGALYWGACAVAAPGAPSAWENCALFDDRGRWTAACLPAGPDRLP